MIIEREFQPSRAPAGTKKLNFLHLTIHSAAFALFLALIAPALVPAQTSQNFSDIHDQQKSTVHANHAGDKPSSLAHSGEVFIGAYGGAPYTYSSDVHVKRPNGTDFTLHDVDWYGKPFKSPIYYGARVTKWSKSAPFGGMIDFTHSKTISNRKQEVRQSGKINNTPIPPKAQIQDTFRKLEFSHGHNMLTLNGLYRLPIRTSNISPYIGLGAGISIPHTEIRFKGDLTRTYEYQYTGPAFQALIGFEFRLPTMSIFLEYKFTFADYSAPLTFRDGVYVPQDLWNQFTDWRAGNSGKGGDLTTKLVSHQIIGGFGMRLIPKPVAK